MNHQNTPTAIFLRRSATRFALIATVLIALGMGDSDAAAKSISVAAGDDLQDAFDQAEYGDVIELEAGATFEGNFALRKSPRSTRPDVLRDRRKRWIVVRSSAHKQLPARGTRVGPSHAKLMPKIVTPNNFPALATKYSADRYQLVGLEITTTAKQVHNLVLLGSDGPDSREATTLARLPLNIVFERCYIHGTTTGKVRRGIALNGRSISIMDCHLSDIHVRGQDAQALCGWNGPGPFKIVNNFLEGSGENVMFGGGDPEIKGLVPSDIEIRYNHFFKPQSWHKNHKDFAGIEWTVKNLLEFKNARRVLVEGNIFENCWVQAQRGFAILLTPRNEQRTAPWSCVEDVLIQKNLIRNVSAGIQMMNQEINMSDGNNTRLSKRMQRVTVRDNVFWNVNGEQNGGQGQMFLLAAQPNAEPALQIVIENNTLLHSGKKAHSFIAVGDNDKFARHLIVRNNITTMGDYGFKGSGTSSGTATIDRYFDGVKLEGNVFISSRSLKNYPSNNYSAASLADVGFRNAAGGDLRLSTKSRYRNLGTDRLHPGADHVMVVEAIEGVIGGDRNKLMRERASRTARASGKVANSKQANSSGTGGSGAGPSATNNSP